MKKLPQFLLSLLCATSCMTDDDPAVSVDSDPLAVCDCEPPTAADIAYDNAGSDLTSVLVKGALDELAARQAPVIPDFADRIEFVENDNTDVGGNSYASLALCNCGQPGHTVIGGGCETTDTSNSILVEAKIVEGSGFRCEWRKPGGTATGTAQATCVAPAP